MNKKTKKKTTTVAEIIEEQISAFFSEPIKKEWKAPYNSTITLAKELSESIDCLSYDDALQQIIFFTLTYISPIGKQKENFKCLNELLDSEKQNSFKKNSLTSSRLFPKNI